jgi:hypothetical protein
MNWRKRLEMGTIQLIRRGKTSWAETRLMMNRRTMMNGRRDRTLNQARPHRHRRNLLESE